MKILDALLGRRPEPESPLINQRPSSEGRSEEQPRDTLDTELYRTPPGDYYSDSIFVTREGSIGINVGGYVFVKPLRRWHALAVEDLQRRKPRTVNEPPITTFADTAPRGAEAAPPTEEEV